jgi:hypothetical protein
MARPERRKKTVMVAKINITKLLPRSAPRFNDVKVKLSLQQTVEAYRIVHNVYTIGP